VLRVCVLERGKSAQRWRRAAIAVFVLGIVFFGWSWLTPLVKATWLNRSVILMLVVFGLTSVYAILLKQTTHSFPDWTSAARNCVPWLLGAGVVALFFCLGTEVRYQLHFGAVLLNSHARLWT